MILRFEIPGEPVAKQRARTGRGFAYTPQKTVLFEKKVALLAQHAATKAGWFLAGPETAIQLVVTIFEKMPKSWSAKKRKLMMGAPCLKNKDASNIVKALEDGINHTSIWHDDRQVAKIIAGHFWEEEPGCIVAISEFHETRTR